MREFWWRSSEDVSGCADWLFRYCFKFLYLFSPTWKFDVDVLFPLVWHKMFCFLANGFGLLCCGECCVLVCHLWTNCSCVCLHGIYCLINFKKKMLQFQVEFWLSLDVFIHHICFVKLIVEGCLLTLKFWGMGESSVFRGMNAHLVLKVDLPGWICWPLHSSFFISV